MKNPKTESKTVIWIFYKLLAMIFIYMTLQNYNGLWNKYWKWSSVLFSKISNHLLVKFLISYKNLKSQFWHVLTFHALVPSLVERNDYKQCFLYYPADEKEVLLFCQCIKLSCLILTLAQFFILKGIKNDQMQIKFLSTYTYLHISNVFLWFTLTTHIRTS